MGEVIYLPGVEPQDAAPETEPDEPASVSDNAVLTHALKLGVTNVIVVGRQKDGARFVSSGPMDNDKMVGVLMDAVTFLTNGVYDSAVVTSPETPQEPS